MVFVTIGNQLVVFRFVQASTTTTRPLAQLILNPNRFVRTPKLSSSCASGHPSVKFATSVRLPDAVKIYELLELTVSPFSVHLTKT